MPSAHKISWEVDMKTVLHACTDTSPFSCSHEMFNYSNLICQAILNKVHKGREGGRERERRVAMHRRAERSATTMISHILVPTFLADEIARDIFPLYVPSCLHAVLSCEKYMQF